MAAPPALFMPPPRWMAYVVWDASGEAGMQLSSVRSADHVQLMATSAPERSPMCRSTYCSIPLPIAPLKRNVMREPVATPAAPAAGDTDMNAAPADVLPAPDPFMPDPILSFPPPQAPTSAAARRAADAPSHLVI